MDATAQELIARLRRNPDDAEAFAALRAHYQRIGDYASLANLLEGWAGRARDKGAAARALFEAGELVLGALSDNERAIRLYERALASEPRQQDSFLRLRGLFDDAGDLRRLAELLERHGAALAQAGVDPREVALVYHQLGELYEHRFSRADKAVSHYRRAFELDPGLVPAIYAAREIYRQAGNVKAAASLLEKEAKAELEGRRRIALWRELAHVRAEELDDHEGAALALKRALGDAPGDPEVMTDLAGIYLARAERVQDEHIVASDRLRASDLFYQIAQKLPAEHALGYLESALDARPDHEPSLALYERLAIDLGQGSRLPIRWVAFLAHAPERPEAGPRRKQLAEAYLAAGQVDYAITCLEWLLEDRDPEAAARLVELYRSRGREEEAVRALGVAVLGLPPAERVPRLRELIAALRDRGDLAGAAGHAREVLAIDPGDPEALTLIEDAARQSGDYAPLREALLAASRVSGLSAEGRKQRLRDVAAISESKLDDLDGAISAWRGVAALDPADRDARAALKRLFSAGQRWDDLADVLEREALSLTDPMQRAEIHRQLAELHRAQRGDLPSAIVALRHLHELAPGDAAGRDALCDALLEMGAALEAVPLLRQRVEAARGDERTGLLRMLATVLEEHVGDEDGAFEAWARLLDEAPTDLDAIAHMEAIDEAAGRHERLLSTLSYRVEVVAPEERAGVLVRMAHLADASLGDLDRAAELYARALELAPGDASTLDALCHVYDRAERYRDLVVLLRRTAQAEADPRRRGELYRSIARTLGDRVGNDEGAAEAWREVLAHGEDEEALRFLRRHAVRSSDAASLEDVLRRLTELLHGSHEVRDLMLERAELLAEPLARPADAILVLRAMVENVAPDHVVALGRLAALCERVGDRAGLAEALWRELALLEDAGLRLPVARRLADLHETELPDATRAIDALFAWAHADPGDPDPLRRLAPLLERSSRFAELTMTLDTLAALELDDLEVSRLLRESARVAYRQLGDVNGAWDRLEPRVHEGDAAAEEDLRELARGAGLGERLAELYVGLAQSSAEPDPRRRWMDAARVQEEYLGDPGRALESVLRAFAIDLSAHAVLDEADRLAERARAWARLGQVYETLVRRSEGTAEKIAFLLRHAALLDTRAADPSASLDQTLRACSLAPLDDAVLALAEERAPRAGRLDELLVTYDKRKQRAEDDAGRVEALLRGTRLCEVSLRDRPRATHYLAQAVALTVRSPALTEVVEAAARALDGLDGSAGGMRRAIVDIEAALAEDMEDDPAGGAELLMRAARLLANELGAIDDAFAKRMRAASLAPSEARVLDELEAFARQIGRLRELDRHLAALVEEALDSRSAGALLRRRGRVLEELGQHAAAAEVWTRLSTVIAGDAEARERLRECLRAAGQHQDLLVALQRDLKRADAGERLALMKEIAWVWERDLGNRWEALDAWKRVSKEAPGDADAQAALGRLDQRRASSSDAEIESVPSPDRAPAGAPDEYADMTDPSEEQASPPDSSETTVDPGLFAELLAAQASLMRTKRQTESAPLPSPSAPREPETRRLDASRASTVEPATRELAARVERAPEEGDSAPPQALSEASLSREAPPTEPPPRYLPGGPHDEFDDDYTSVAEDVFGQIRDLVAPLRAQLGRGANTDSDEVPTGEVELFDEPDELAAVAAEVLGADVEDLEELEELDAVEEIGDELEEIDDIEELDASPRRTVPPPPPGSSPPPRRS